MRSGVSAPAIENEDGMLLMFKGATKGARMFAFVAGSCSALEDELMIAAGMLISVSRDVLGAMTLREITWDAEGGATSSVPGYEATP